MYQNKLINAHTVKNITLKHCYFIITSIYNSALIVSSQVVLLPVSSVELIDLKIARPP